MNAAGSRNIPAEEIGDARCHIEMLGGLQVVRSGERLTRFARQKAGMLLAYLALFPGRHARERLVDLFWPEMDLPEGRDNLSTALASLRRQIEPPGVPKGSVLQATHAQVGLNAQAVTTDVAAFEKLLDQAQAEQTTDRRASLLNEAVTLYRGELLPGSYEDWAIRESDRLQVRYLRALTTLAQDQEALGSLGDACETARKRVAADPYTEDGHLHLIRLSVSTGQTAAARDAWSRFEKLFTEEYGSGPSPTIRAQIEKALAEPSRPANGPAPVQVAPSAPDPGLPSSPAASQTRSPAAPPIVVSRFFGREVEMNGIIHLLLPRKDWTADASIPEPPCRLVTLTGPGGIGKTRLALEIARRVAERVPSWCGFVSLAEVADPERVAERIATALSLSPSKDTPLIDQIAAFFDERDTLGNGPLLLVIDNLEQLLSTHDSVPSETVRLVQTLLERASGLSLLCTSRQRLGLRGERVVPISPLPVPDSQGGALSSDDLMALATVPSVRLYLDRAQAVRPDFALTSSNAPAVAALCRQLEGSPLALELAAAWVRTLPPRKMWERLTAGQDIPAGAYADLPARHRSLSAALDWSWRLLSLPEQRLWARLTVFRGGWTAEAAEAVCDEPDAQALLARLEEASLLTVMETESGETRYGLLETVRAFGAARLQEIGQSAELRQRHAAYFLRLAQTAEPELRGPSQGEWLTRLDEDHDNLRAVLEWHLSQDTDEATEEGVLLAVALTRFWSVRGHWAEADRWLSLLRARPLDGLADALRARLLNGCAAFAMWQGENARAEALYEECLALRRQIGDLGRVADSLHNLGYMAVGRGDLARARTFYEESLMLSRQLGDQIGIADELHHLGLVAHESGDFDDAQTRYEESLAIRRPLGDRRGLANTLYNLGNIALAKQDLTRAQALYDDSLALRREIGDQQGIAASLRNLAMLSLQRSDGTQAHRLITEAAAIYRQIGDRLGIATVLEGYGAIAVAAGAVERAGRAYGAADALREQIKMPLSPSGFAAQDEALTAVRTGADSERFMSAWSAGRALSWERALDSD